MSRTTRNYEHWAYSDEKFCLILKRGQCSIPKRLYQFTTIWHPEAKKFRKKNLRRKRRRQEAKEIYDSQAT